MGTHKSIEKRSYKAMYVVPYVLTSEDRVID
jgi:hypothetical protein